MRAAALIVFVLISWPAWADEWAAGLAPGDDSKVPVAWIKNGDGHLLVLRGEHEDDAYWVFAELHLSGGEVFGEELPTYQIDDRKPYDMGWQVGRKQYGRTWGRIEGAFASWTVRVYPENDIGSDEHLHSWLNGDEIVLTYELPSGFTKTTRFQLDGLRAALVAATGANIEE
jgi:hypothetical protein